MSRIELAPEVADDFERILDHLVSHDAAETNAPAPPYFCNLRYSE